MSLLAVRIKANQTFSKSVFIKKSAQCEPNAELFGDIFNKLSPTTAICMSKVSHNEEYRINVHFLTLAY